MTQALRLISMVGVVFMLLGVGSIIVGSYTSRLKALRITSHIAGILVLLLGLGVTVLVPRPLTPPADIVSLQELEAYLEALAGHNADSPQGLSLVVVKDAQIVYSGAFGAADGPRAIPTTPDTAYSFWSMTKVFTGIAILQLRERGMLGLDTPVRNYLSFVDVRGMSH